MAGTTTDLLLGFAKERKDMPAWGNISGTPSKIYDGAIPTADVLDFMDYPLVEGSLSTTYLTDDGVTTQEVPDRKAIVRADTGVTLGVFKHGYQIHQPKEWLVQNLELLLDDGLQVGQARLIRGGAVALVQVELPESRETAGVKFRPYLTAVTSHDGTLATTYFTGNIVLTCENQMGYVQREARKDGSLMKIRHSSGSLVRIGEARERLGLVVEQAGDAFDEEVRKLTAEYVSDQTWNDFLRALTKVDDKKEGRSKTIAENQVATLNRLWNDDERVAPWRNSAYGVLAAVNTAQHHEFTVRGDRDERNAIRTIEGKWDALDRNTLRVLAEVR